MHEHVLVPEASPPRPKLEVADIFRAHGEAFRARFSLTEEQRKAMAAIETCRTAVLGGHMDACDRCDFERPSYNSCRNRHCPKCQALTQSQWLDKHLEKVLPCPYFHLVFTLPSQLRELTRLNPKRMFELLFEASTETLKQLGEDPKRLGAQLGLTAVLHTWTRKLEFHPHIHCIVTGGGLTREETPRWKTPRSRRFLFPGRVLRKLFRGKFLGLLSEARARGELIFEGVCAHLNSDSAFAMLRRALYRIEWNVHAEAPFGGPEQVYAYLGHYTHRVGLSNHRLLAFDERGVTFTTRNKGTLTLAPEEFIRRFLLHVLPYRFVKIRHFGLHAPGNVHTRLAHARRLLQGGKPPPECQGERPDAPTDLAPWAQRLWKLTGVDVKACPKCQTGRLERHPMPEGRAPP